MYLQCTFSPYLAKRLISKIISKNDHLHCKYFYRAAEFIVIHINDLSVHDCISLFAAQRHRLLSLISLITPRSFFLLDI